MQSAWYRHPEEKEEDEPHDTARGARGARRRGRGRGRARGAGRGRGRGRPARDAAPQHHIMDTMGQHAPSAPHPYYDPSAVEDILPHWQYVHRAAHRNPNPAMLGHQQFPARRDEHAGPFPYGPYEAAAREQFRRFDMQAGSVRPPAFPHAGFSYPAYAHYANQILTQHPTHRQRVDQRTGQRGHKVKQTRASTVPTKPSQQISYSSISNPANSKALSVQGIASPAHHVSAQSQNSVSNAVLAATIAARRQAQKTLDETAAFLNDPQVILQQANILSSSNVIHPALASNEALLQIPTTHEPSDNTVKITPTKAHPLRAAVSHPDQLMPFDQEVKTLSARDATYIMHDDRATSAQIPDFRKYSELSVTVVDVEPPPAHQASVAKKDKFLLYPDLHTPPLAHQAPVSQTPAQPQSARINAGCSPTPPPAHQSSISRSIHHPHASHIEKLPTICPLPAPDHFRPQVRQLSILDTDVATKRVNSQKSKSATNASSKRQRQSNMRATTDNIFTAAHTIYHPHQLLGEAQIVYQPSTETYASEQVLYRPESDVFTKEQIVYQPRNNTLAATQVVYQPRTDFIARAEALYQSDTVATRRTVIQGQAAAMETRQAAYNTQQNVASASNSVRVGAQPDILTAADIALLYRQQAEIAAAVNRFQIDLLRERQASFQSAIEAQAHGTAPILRNILSNENEPEESSETIKKITALLLEHNNALNRESNSIDPNQTRKQTRKRKRAPTQPSPAQPQQPLPSTSTGAPPAASAVDPHSIALNWTLQSLPGRWQVMPYYIELLKQIIMNNANTADPSNDDED